MWVVKWIVILVWAFCSLSTCSGDALDVDYEETRNDSCCQNILEGRLDLRVGTELDQDLNEVLTSTLKDLDGLRETLDDHFETMLNLSKLEFRKVFKRTYGLVFIRNPELFEEIFQVLETDYQDDTNDLQVLLKQYFVRVSKMLYKTMTQQHTVSNEYMNCVETFFSTSKFDGIYNATSKIAEKWRPIVNALKVFAEGIDTPASVISNTLKVDPTINCLYELMKLKTGSTCADQVQGFQGFQPCRSYCLSVYEHCLAHHLSLEEAWFSYLDAMQSVMKRLQNRLNLQDKLNSVWLQVSDFLMEYQEQSTMIDFFITETCGELGYRGKRSIDRSMQSDDEEEEEEEVEEDEEEEEEVEEDEDEEEDDDDDEGTTKKRTTRWIMRRTGAKLTKLRHLWKTLPAAICDDEKEAVGANCWDGAGLQQYEDRANVTLPTSTSSSQMEREILRLEAMTAKLRQIGGIEVASFPSLK